MTTPAQFFDVEAAINKICSAYWGPNVDQAADIDKELITAMRTQITAAYEAGRAEVVDAAPSKSFADLFKNNAQGIEIESLKMKVEELERQLAARAVMPVKVMTCPKCRFIGGIDKTEPEQPEQPVAADALRLALAYIRWQAYGDCRTAGHYGPPPLASEVDEALVSALNATPTQPEQPAAQTVDVEDVGLMEYRGNSVSFIYQKMTAYRAGIDAAWEAMKAAGVQPDGRKNLAQAITALAQPVQPADQRENLAVNDAACALTHEQAYAIQCKEYFEACRILPEDRLSILPAACAEPAVPVQQSVMPEPAQRPVAWALYETEVRPLYANIAQPVPPDEQTEFTSSTYDPPGLSNWLIGHDKGVRVTHRSGLFEQCHTERGIHANQAVALERLKDRLAAQ